MNDKLAYLAQTNPSIQEAEWWSCAAAPIAYLDFWTRSEEGVAPRWNCGSSGHKVMTEVDPPTDCTLMSPAGSHGERANRGLPGRAMSSVNPIPDDCEPAPGVQAHRIDVAPRCGLFGGARAEL